MFDKITPLFDDPNGTTVDLSSSLMKRDFGLVAKALATSTTVKKLILANNPMGPGETQLIAAALKVNQTLTELDLGDNPINDEGAEYLFDALKTNRTLKKLILRNNQFMPHTIKAFANGWKTNQTLTELTFEQSGIDSVSEVYIAPALGNNTALTTLNLNHNQIRGTGLAKALKVNRTLISLSLEKNTVNPDGAKCLADTLKINSMLKKLNLGENPTMGPEGVKHIVEALETNNTLVELDLRDNKIDAKLLDTLLDSLEKNASITSFLVTQGELGGALTQVPTKKQQNRIDTWLNRNKESLKQREHREKQQQHYPLFRKMWWNDEKTVSTPPTAENAMQDVVIHYEQKI